MILREINFGESSSAKSAILTHLEDVNFHFREFLHFWSLKFSKFTKFRVTKIAKKALLKLLESFEIDFT